MARVLFGDVLLTTYSEGEGDVWKDEPTVKGTIVYSMITPVLCLIGICSNTLSLIVLRRKELSGSVYTYLAVLAATDLFSSILLLLGGLSRGALWYDGWGSYDALVGLPLGGAVNYLCVCATVAVTLDRVIFLSNPIKCAKPKVCKPIVARRIMLVCLIISIIFNIPYCFIFDWDKDGKLITTRFFDSTYYTIHNWTCLMIFCIIPSIILICGNGILIKSLRKAKKIGKKCKKSCKKKDHRNLTITLILVIVIFLVSEIPANLISRTSAVSILFNGDHDKANTKTVEVLREICTVIGAINITINFFLYYIFCPPFCRAFRKTFERKQRKCVPKTWQLNVFVLNGDNLYATNRRCSYKDMRDKIFELSRKSMDNVLPKTLNNLIEDIENNDYHGDTTTREKNTEFQSLPT